MMNGNSRTCAQLREHYLIEKELADRLRRAAKDERRQLYPVVYDERSRRIPHHPLVVRAADRSAQLRAALPQTRLLRRFARPDMVWLEIGAGDCAVALAMTAWVKKVIALDVSGELVKSLRAPANFEFRQFDGIDFGLPAESVAFAYSNDVLEHLHPEDAYEQLQNLWRVLQPGARYLCITPNRLSGPHDVSRYFEQTAAGFHLKEYTLTELTELFRQIGFQVRALLSVNGYMLSPLLSPRPFMDLEATMTRVPPPTRRNVARLLSVIKIIATK